MSALLEVRHLRMDYQLERGVHPALKGVSFDIREGEFFTLLGPSGCGKTTTLRSVAGLEIPTGGSIAIAGRTVFDASGGRVVPTNRRDISMVFQSYAIWPHMTVAENVGFPLGALGRPRSEIGPAVRRALDMVGLADYYDRPATQLSGGQQQRVALARAIVKGAKLILLDEPLSNLDAKLREQMRNELRQLQNRLGTTSLYVTHDQDEALSLSDRVAVMRDGEIVELGSPQDLYLRPRHRFTAQFVGQAQLMDARAKRNGGGGMLVETAIGDLLSAANVDLGDAAGSVMIRPEHILIVDPDTSGSNPSSGPNLFSGVVVEAAFSGKLVEYRIAVGEVELTVQSASITLHEPGAQVRLHVPPERAVLLTD